MKKTIIFTVIVFVSVVVLSIGIYTAWLFYIPSDCKYISAKIGSAEVDQNNDIIWNGSLDHRIIKDQYPQDCRQAYATLKSLSLKKTDAVLTDCQMVEFTLQYEGTTESKKWYIAYDFVLDDVFMLKDGEWYLIRNHKGLDKLITMFIDCEGEYMAPMWRAQSTYSGDEFIEYTYTESDFENATFRYNLYWKSSYDRTLENCNLRDWGFKNTEAVSITSKEEAIERAVEEFGYGRYLATAFYDKTCGYWMVEICYNPEQEMNLAEFEHFLFDNVRTVIMTDQGITLEIYDNATEFAAFVLSRYGYYPLRNSSSGY